MRTVPSLLLSVATCLAWVGAVATAREVAAAPAPVERPARSAHPAVTEVALTEQPALVRTVRARPAELEASLRSAIFALIAAAASHGLELAGPPFARYLERGETWVVEAGVPVTTRPTGKLGAGNRAGALPAGPAAMIEHVGRRAQLGDAHAALDRWLADQHRTAAGPRWEIYLTSPLTEPDPAAQQTRVVVPLAR